MLNWTVEIEKKFLIKGPLPELKNGEDILQGFICAQKAQEIKVRAYSNKGVLSIKTKIDVFKKKRIDIPLSKEDALDLLKNVCSKPPMKKKRYRVDFQGFVWEIDVFEENNKGLILAELELTDDQESFLLPSWVGQEVTRDERYYNSYLYHHPYCEW